MIVYGYYLMCVTCDYHGCKATIRVTTDDNCQTVGEARNKIRIAGWVFKTIHKPLCPEHAKLAKCKCCCHKELKAKRFNTPWVRTLK